MMVVHGFKINLDYFTIYVGVRVAFKKIKYFVTEGDEPVELCLEKVGQVSNAVTVAVSSSDDRATGMDQLFSMDLIFSLCSSI